MLGDRDGVTLWCVNHQDTVFRAGCDIDIVDTHTRLAYHLKTRAGLNNPAGDTLDTGNHGAGFILPDTADQGCFRTIRRHHHPMPCLQKCNTIGNDRRFNQYNGLGHKNTPSYFISPINLGRYRLMIGI